MPKLKQDLPTVSLTPFQQHCDHWAVGCGSDQCAGAKKKCFARGTIPAKVLFVGEGPGASENIIGRPFVGPAGRLLDHIIKRAWSGLEREPTYCITNLVCCIPLDANGGKATEPDDKQVLACAPRLQELVKLCDPQLLVCVGGLARDWTDPGYRNTIRFHKTLHRVEILHPAAILRSNVSKQGLDVQRCVVQLRNAVGLLGTEVRIIPY